MTSHRLLASDIARRIGWRLPALVGLMVAGAAVEGLAVALLLPLLVRLGVAASDAPGRLAAFAEAAAAAAGFGTGPTAILWLIAVAAAAQAALAVLLSWWTARLSRSYATGWQVRLFQAFMTARWPFLTGHRAGDLVGSIVTETGRLAAGFITVAQLLAAIVVAVVYTAFALTLSWRATLGLAAIAAVAVFALAPLYRVSARVGKAIGPLSLSLQAAVGEHVAGIKMVKASAGEARAVARVRKIAEDLGDALATAGFQPGLVRALFEFVAIVGVAALLVLATEAAAIGAADLLVVMALFARLFPRIVTLQTHVHNLKAYAPAIDSLQALAAEAETAREPDGDDAFAPPVLPTTLRLAGVSAGYSGRAAVLSGVDLEIPVPGLVGIVGSSGAGKSTLVHLLLRFVEPTAGTIRLGALDGARLAPSAWRRAVGYVPQETVLFHASIRENIALARPDAPLADIEDAARRAHAHGFIMDLPRGYDTVIGDQGVLLSGGQRQRLAIARALLADPIVLLLDEPTSALDSESEREVMASLRSLQGRYGILVVTHRLASVRGADRIYVLERGQVVETGDWAQLMGAQGRFHAMALAQHMTA